MIKPEQIPDEVAEAAARSFAAHERNWKMYALRMKPAICAALNSWPGMKDEGVGVGDGVTVREWLTLPLPETRE